MSMRLFHATDRGPDSGSSPARPRPADALVALAVLAAAVLLGLALWRPAGSGLTAVITRNGAELETVELSRLAGPEERVLTANGYTLHLLLRPDGAQMTESDCPNGDCVHMGSISRPGQCIVCLPSGIVVLLEGEAETGVDAMLG